MTDDTNIAEFLRYLHGQLDPGEVVYLACADEPDLNYPVSNLDEAISLAQDWQSRGAYLSTGTFKVGTARKKTHLLSIPALAFDLDLKDRLIFEGVDPKEADRKIRECSPEKLERLCNTHRQWIYETFSSLDLEPSLLSFTGGGHQVFLTLDLQDIGKIDRIIQVQKALVKKLNENIGWELCDPSAQDAGTRYIRVAGTANTKSNPPRWAAVVQNGGCSYTLAQLEAAVGQQSEEKHDTASEETGNEEEASVQVVNIILPYWNKGKRHALALGLSGFLGKHAWSWSQVKRCLVAIARQAQDEELQGRLRDLETTFHRLARGEEVKGYSTLDNILTAADLRQLEEVVGSFEIPIDDTTAAEDWPKLHENALYGLPGKIVNAISPFTEADPVALLVNLLVMFGGAVGATPYFSVEYTKHYLRLFAVLVGLTSKGRKGQSMSALRYLFTQVDHDWVKDRVSSGLSSGEGLVFQVRDMRTGTNKEGEIVVLDPGVEDKRFLAVEEEFAGVLKAIAREGNTMSAILRQAWDTGDLHPLTKTNPIRATGAHISLLGHITKNECLRHLNETEQTNGFGNRIEWYLTKRAQIIAKPKGIPPEQLAPLVEELQHAIDFARKTDEMDRDEPAERLWEKVYPELSEGKPGMYGAIIARAEAQVMRLACPYALMDRSAVVRVDHLKAALALWKYSEASARYIFGDALGDPVADDILAALRGAPEGLTRTDLREFFGRHKRSATIGRALGVLLKAGLVRRETKPTQGRPEERWYAAAR